MLLLFCSLTMADLNKLNVLMCISSYSFPLFALTVLQVEPVNIPQVFAHPNYCSIYSLSAGWTGSGASKSDKKVLQVPSHVTSTDTHLRSEYFPLSTLLLVLRFNHVSRLSA